MSNSATSRVPEPLHKGSKTPIQVLGGQGSAQPSDEVLAEGLSSTGLVGEGYEPSFMAKSLAESVIQGGYFDFSYDGSLWGLVGNGPDGYHWERNGVPYANPYVPGTFGTAATGTMKPVLFNPANEPVRPEDFRVRYLAGLDGAFQFLGSSFENVFRYYWQVSLGDLEARLGQLIWPRLILCDGTERGFRPGVDFDLEEREYDYRAKDFLSWGWTQLRYRPVMQILQYSVVFPTGQEILRIPGAWLKPQPLSGQVRIVPPQGALSQIVIGPGGYLVTLIGGMFTDMPAVLFIDYVAGMWPIPDILLHAVNMQTAIHLFTLASDALQQGMMQTEASLEDVVNERRVFTTSPAASAFEARIQRYQREIDRIVEQWSYWSGGAQGHVLVI